MEGRKGGVVAQDLVLHFEGGEDHPQHRVNHQQPKGDHEQKINRVAEDMSVMHAPLSSILVERPMGRGFENNARNRRHDQQHHPAFSAGVAHALIGEAFLEDVQGDVVGGVIGSAIGDDLGLGEGDEAGNQLHNQVEQDDGRQN